MKKIITIIFTLCFVLFFTSKSYGQGWERIIPNYQTNSANPNAMSNEDICSTNDGGAIITHHYFGTDNNKYLKLNRFDKLGNLIWDQKRITQTSCNGANCPPDFIDSLDGDVTSLIQLKNNNIVLTYENYFFSSNSNGRYLTLVMIDNYGRYFKKKILVDDSLVVNNFNFLNNTHMSIRKLYYVEDKDEIECISIQAISLDTIIFKKSVFDTSLNLINSIQNKLFIPGIGSNIGKLTPCKSLQNGYLWNTSYYDYQGFGGESLSQYKHYILKIDNNGDLVYFKNPVSSVEIINKILTAVPQNSPYILDPSLTQSGADIDENMNGELSFGINVFCRYQISDSLTSAGKTYHLIYTLDSLGEIIHSNIISSLIDTLGIPERYYSIFNFAGNINNAGEAIFTKYINLDTLLILRVNYSAVPDRYNSIWETYKLNVRNGNVFNHRLFKPLGYNGYYQSQTGSNSIKKITKDNKYMFVNLIYSEQPDGYYRNGIAKIDNNGFPFFNTIFGNVYGDADNNCTKNTLEKGIPNYTVTATKNNFNNFGTTDRNGNYFIGLADSGNYTVAVRNNPAYPLWNSVCTPTQTVTVENEIAFDTANFALKPSILCPYNIVNVSSAPPFRIGQPQTYYVSYCNNGTIASPNTYITLKLDSLLDINSASISYTALPNHTYRFNISILDFLTCGNFTITATPRTSGVQIGQSLCIKAHIYPDTICTTPNYTGAFIEADAQCLGDSVRLQLQNIGNGNMIVPKRYIVIEGNVMRINQPYQLNQNEILIEQLKADSGQTYRIIAEQPDDLPASYGDKFATAGVENCQPVQNFATGFFNQFPVHTGAPYVSQSCNVITGAYDPNDKVATPVGYGTAHYIEQNVSIEYQINFQNTGNDTAFKVVLVDTISQHLDINSIRLGASSHRYQFMRTDSNVVQFVFDSIKLVDSFRNERLSHGFVKFSIQQKPNNAIGTKIYNNADIYFDYNAPIRTNTTMHTVGRDFIQVDLISEIKNTNFNVKEIKIMPNPFREKTQIKVESDLLKNPVLLLMNIQGQLLKTISSSSQNMFDIDREDLSNGIYLFKILQNNEEVASGKLVVQ